MRGHPVFNQLTQCSGQTPSAGIESGRSCQASSAESRTRGAARPAQAGQRSQRRQQVSTSRSELTLQNQTLSRKKMAGKKRDKKWQISTPARFILDQSYTFPNVSPSGTAVTEEIQSQQDCSTGTAVVPVLQYRYCSSWKSESTAKSNQLESKDESMWI